MGWTRWATERPIETKKAACLGRFFHCFSPAYLVLLSLMVAVMFPMGIELPLGCW